MKTFFILITIILAFSSAALAETSAQIVSIRGEVKVRYGVEEKWYPAAKGMMLKYIDTILSGENGQVLLRTSDQKTFILGANAVLDIADLRDIQEKDMFLYLMAQKVNQLETPNTKTRLRVGNVSVIHGSLSKADENATVDSTQALAWAALEKNGAVALLQQKFVTNSIIKLYKIINHYGSRINLGEIYFYIGKGFEKINKTGQAIDAYEKSLEYYNNKPNDSAKLRINGINKMIISLKKEQ